MSEELPEQWAAWQQEGARLLTVPSLRRSEQSSLSHRDPKFMIGDFLVQVPSQHVEALATSLDADPIQWRIYREVATKVPPEQRVAASWTVHRDLRERPDLLQPGLSVRQAATLLGKQPIDAKADRRLSARERAAKVRAALADPAVYALIEQEMVQSRAERQVRARARQVHSETARHRKELDEELRALQQAMSPLEAVVKAELEVNKAAQVVEAVGSILVDLPERQRVITALRDLALMINEVLLDDAEASTEDGAVIVVSESWQSRPVRAALTDS